MRLLLISNSTNFGENYLAWAANQIEFFCLQNNINKDSRIIFVPFAGINIGGKAYPESYDAYEAKVKGVFAEKFGLTNFTSVHHFDDKVKAVKEADCIVVGGGNEAASDSVQLDIICVDHIGSVYGGARNADVTGNINLKIGSGSIDNVFGGNNIGGNISGAIAIDVQHDGCSPVAIGNLYGAGNLADYTAPAGTQYSPLINLKTCGETPVDWRNEGTHCMKVGTIFGGGKGQKGDDKGKVTGNPQVNVYEQIKEKISLWTKYAS